MRSRARSDGRHGVFATKRSMDSVRPSMRSARRPLHLEAALRLAHHEARARTLPATRGSAPVPMT
jgi:hypothetical protein